MSAFVLSTLDISPVILRRAGTLLNALRSDGNASLVMWQWSHVIHSKTQRYRACKSWNQWVTMAKQRWYKAPSEIASWMEKTGNLGEWRDRKSQWPEGCWRSQCACYGHCCLERVCKWEIEDTRKKGKRKTKTKT